MDTALGIQFKEASAILEQDIKDLMTATFGNHLAKAGVDVRMG